MLNPVQAATMQSPRTAAGAALAVGLLARLVQVLVERDEVERGADPDDRGRHVEPAEDDVEPARDVGVYPEDHLSSAIATNSESAVSSSCSVGFAIRLASTRRISDFGRRLTKTTKRNPWRASYSAFSRASSASTSGSTSEP